MPFRRKNLERAAAGVPQGEAKGPLPLCQRPPWRPADHAPFLNQQIIRTHFTRRALIQFL
jgi:hypothetical protein